MSLPWDDLRNPVYEREGWSVKDATFAHRDVVPEESFNAVDCSNAASLYDWRHLDGHYYLLYAGNTEKETYRNRGRGAWGATRTHGSTCT